MSAVDDIGRLTYRDLLELKLVRNRATLRNRILHHGFPPGRLTGPNNRTWSRGEIRDYVENCPVKPKAVTPPARAARPRSSPPKQPNPERAKGSR